MAHVIDLLTQAGMLADPAAVAHTSDFVVRVECWDNSHTYEIVRATDEQNALSAARIRVLGERKVLYAAHGGPKQFTCVRWPRFV